MLRLGQIVYPSFQDLERNYVSLKTAKDLYGVVVEIEEESWGRKQYKYEIAWASESTGLRWGGNGLKCAWWKENELRTNRDELNAYIDYCFVHKGEYDYDWI